MFLRQGEESVRGLLDADSREFSVYGGVRCVIILDC